MRSFEVIVPNEAEVLPTTLVIRCDENRFSDVTITGIEIYADTARQILIADDVQFDSLPGSTRLMVTAALHAHLHTELENQNRQALANTGALAITNEMLQSHGRVWDDFFARISR